MPDAASAVGTGPSRLGGTRGTWRHQGLNFDAPFPLGPRGPGQPIDVVVEVDEPKPLGAPAAWPVVSELRAADRALFSLYDTGDEYVARAHGLCQFRADRAASRVLCEPEPGADPAWLPVFMTGTITSLLLTLRGYAVLHGSAVTWGGATVLFMGPAGKGKTTMAALCCAAGARFVTDDLVTVVKADGAMASLGLSSELRLRQSAGGLARLFPAGTPMRETVDGRLAVSPPPAERELNRISAVVIPQPTRDGRELGMRRLPPPEAAVQLLSNARAPGMVAATLQEGYFEAVTALAACVPVVEAFVPWGPPFSASLVRQLLGRALQEA
jgi:hypothetical protein